MPESRRARPPEPEQGKGKGKRSETEWQRRKRLAEVFGDVLPDTTSDERDERDLDGDSSEEWLRRQVPPHHGS